MNPSFPEPIAIIGLGCRFPGAPNIAEYWRMMCGGVDAIRDVPSNRWDREAFYDRRPATRGKMVTRQGGFVDGLDQFDPLFFGMSPREAASVDPQQRLLLEVGWEALEDAGLLPARMRNSRTGVFLGLCTEDYANLQRGSLQNLDAYVGTGSGRASAGRLAFVLGLNGPAFVVDTACSSSLVATHLAVEAIRNHECDMAFVGGANAILTPYIAVAFSQGGMLSPEGRCKAFDESANGFVRSEGAGVVVLQPLSRALEENNRIYAIIRGTAINNDGAYSTFMMPAREGQEAVLRQAYERAGVAPCDVHYVEAHGTGTRVGDPAEVAALNAVLGQDRPKDRICHLGSSKTNIGHTEGAAGMAGLIKAALCLHHRAIPPNLHCRNLNTAIPWDEIPFKVQTRMTDWPENGHPRFAGVNSFGISGTNAHAVLEQAPSTSRAPEPHGEEHYVLPLSAKSGAALKEAVQSYSDLLGCEAEPVLLRDLSYTASCRRAHHAYRVAVSGNSRESLRVQLEARVSDDFPEAVRQPRAAWIFSGVGSQWTGMGRQLRAREPVFNDALLRCNAAILRASGLDIINELEAVASKSRLDRIDIMQPAIFSVQVALAALWRSWGIEPAAVAGHSMGEFAAAYVAEALSLEDAVLGILARSRLMHGTTGMGRMLAVELTLENARKAVGSCHDRVTVAVWNSQSSTVLSGDSKALDQIRERLEQEGIFCRWLKVDVACHSLQMRALTSDLAEELRAIAPRTAKLPLYSSVTGLPVSGEELTGEYWARNLAEPVLFAPLLQNLLAAGFETFLEVSPHPLLQVPIQQNAREANKTVVTIPSLRRDQDERSGLLASLAGLYAAGMDVQWNALFPDKGNVVSLPPYSWQRSRYWYSDTAGGTRRLQGLDRHPLLQTHWEPAACPGTHIWETEIDLERLPYLKDHRLQGVPLAPAALYSAMALAASFEVLPPGPRVLRHMELLRPLFLSHGEVKRLQLVLSPVGRRYTFSVFVRQNGDDSAEEPWVEYVKGQLEYEKVELTERQALDFSPESLAVNFPNPVSSEDMYRFAAQLGLEYGPALRANRQLWLGDMEVVAEVQIPEATAGDSPFDLYHPALLDSITHSGFAAVNESMNFVWLPVEVKVLEIHHPLKPHTRLWCHARRTPVGTEFMQQETFAFDAQGRLMVRDVRIQKFIKARSSESDPTSNWMFEPEWELKPGPASITKPRENWIVIGGDAEFGEQLADLLGGVFQNQEQLPNRPIQGIVYLGALGEPAGETLGQASERICGGALRLIHELSGRQWTVSPRVWMVTRGAQTVRREDRVALPQTPLLGVARVMANEYPQMQVTRLDLSPQRAPEDARILARELQCADEEPEIAIRGEDRFVLRLNILSGGPQDRALRPRKIKIDPSSPISWQLECPTPGMLDQLKLRIVERRAPGPGEIEIQVLAAGLNFLDVLRALNMLPPEAVGPAFYGMECCGRVVSLGDGVDRFRIGDEVVVRDAHDGCFRAFLTTSAAAVWPKPPQLTAEQATTIPVAYQTAYYALHHLARIRTGESVLIHSAAGGVGLAAVELARQAGAKIFATAGSPDKREYLRSLGIEHVFDSRTLDFAQEILDLTAGRGVDIALNSLAAEAISRTLATLAIGGRFVEIGKRDIYGDTKLGMLPFQKNLSFFAVDLLRLSWERPDLVESLADEIAQRMASGVFPPLPITTFSISDVGDAFHFMAQGKHIGKIVIRFDQPEVEALPPAPRDIRADATYLITGGFGDLALQCAKSLADKGARHLVLMGRRGRIPEAESALAELREKGVEVLEVAGDVSLREEVRNLLGSIRRTMPPLKGVIHAAGIVRDGVLANMDWAQFESVLPAKVDGSWNLHAELTGTDLDFFVLFSSVAAAMGAPGQGNYAAGNAFLDGLAQYRQAQGLPAVSIAWAAWSEIGMAARLGMGGPLARAGIGSVSPTNGVRILHRMSQHDGPQVCVLPIDWESWAARFAEIRNPLFARFSNGVNPALVTGEKGEGAADTILAAKTDAEGVQLFENYLRAQASAVLRIPEGKLDPRIGLDRLGVDSLMAVELKNRIEHDLPLTIPVVMLLRGPSIAGMAATLHANLKGLAESVAVVSAMSDENIADLLAGDPTV